MRAVGRAARAAAMPRARTRFASASSSSSSADVNIQSVTGRPRAAAIHVGGESLDTISLDIDAAGVVQMQLNRPKVMNAFNMPMWDELREAFAMVDRDANARCVVLSGAGNAFSAGMDLSVFGEMQATFQGEKCAARAREHLFDLIKWYQDAISAPERCRVPVLAAVHGACVGGAVDLVTACDLRYSTEDAFFSVKEVDLAIVADIGTLQRLPKIVGDQTAREMAYTGRNVGGAEAAQLGLTVRGDFADADALRAGVGEVAAAIAGKSPVTIRGVKRTLVYARDHPVDEALHQVALYNSAMLFSEDLDYVAAHKGMEYAPVLFPGFSWTNMHRNQTSQTPPAPRFAYPEGGVFNIVPRMGGRFWL